MLDRLRKAITLEPMMFFVAVGNILVIAAQVDMTLMIWKICHITLGYNETICEESFAADADDSNPIKVEVLREVNVLATFIGLATNPLAILYATVTGAISDTFGCKPILIFSLSGYILSSLGSIFNLVFIDTLPLFFFALDKLSQVFGGFILFNLGVYGYGSLIASGDDRAHVLTRFDGIEAIGITVASPLSAIIFSNLGYWGSFLIKLGMHILALTYLLVFVKEPKRPKKEKKDKVILTCTNLPLMIVKLPWETAKTLFKKRDHGMQPLIILQLLCYGCLASTFSQQDIFFIFGVKKYGVDGPTYAYLTMTFSILGALACILYMPFMRKVLKLSESFNMVIGFATASLFTALSGLQSTWVGFFICSALTSLRFTVFGLGRSLGTKSVTESEIGKILSGFSLMAAVVNPIAEVLLRLLFDQTIETFPEAIIYAVAGCYGISALFSLYFMTQQKKFDANVEANLTVVQTGEDLRLSAVH